MIVKWFVVQYILRIIYRRAKDRRSIKRNATLLLIPLSLSVNGEFYKCLYIWASCKFLFLLSFFFNEKNNSNEPKRLRIENTHVTISTATPKIEIKFNSADSVTKDEEEDRPISIE